MKKGLLSVFGIVLLFLLLLLFMVTLYILYLNWPGELQNFTFIETKRQDINYSTSQQFYENMRFPDKRIRYNIKDECSDEKAEDVRRAFSILQEKTILEFSEVTTNSQIIVFCSRLVVPPEEEGYFVAGEGGPTEVINTSLYGAILSGKISLYKDETCDEPNIAIHEVLHVLGFEHNNNPESILYPTLDCDQKIDEYIIEDIENLYSISGKAELEILEVNLERKGRYLNFDIEIINKGLVKVGNASLRIYSDNEFVKEYGLSSIGIGTKKTLEVTNLKIGRYDKKVSFVIDEENEFEEIFEDNNVVEMILADN